MSVWIVALYFTVYGAQVRVLPGPPYDVAYKTAAVCGKSVPSVRRAFLAKHSSFEPDRIGCEEIELR